jgi:membrane protease YdiL (CAAX protease family)
MLALWRRLPVVMRALLAGTVVTTFGTVPWALLSYANQKWLPAVPWSVVVMLPYLWLWFRWFNGAGWPSATSAARRESMRAGAPSADAFSAAVLAGMIGITAMLPFAGVLSRLVRLPAEAQQIRPPEGMPFVTVALLLLMASLVAGMVEEPAFRGYMQGPIERRHGPAVAILGTGALFGFAHFIHHPAGLIPMLPWYMAAAAVYGILAWLTNSIWPGVVVHAIADVFSFGRLWLTGKAEWETSAGATPPPLVWDGGADAAFWGNVAALVLLGGFAVAAYVGLASTTRSERLARVAQPASPH